ncbi:MAG: KpsF/GutQ family sugar-phosphate isomerase [Synergistaceae bacterium]|jgi:arabinose-5-phosphate isomerase|nr:KpsF/GutQ family sugar-phosphate isomerase [Synergistaceae bacterium]
MDIEGTFSFDGDSAACSDEELIRVGREVLLEEARAVELLAERMGREFAVSARLLASCKGRVVISGLGKSGLIGRKIAATFASLGLPAFFLHATEGSHGDLGMVRPDDVGIFISNSGETAELIALLPYFRRIGASVIAMTGKNSSTLAKNSDIVLDVGVPREADPLGLAPTSSTTVQVAAGDALASAFVKLRNLGPDDFALFHPGGALGRSLLLTVDDIMGRGENMPITKLDSTVKDALFAITSKGYGATIVVNGDGELCGIFTDGDLRRLMETRGINALELPVSEGMTAAPRVIEPQKLASEAMRVMEKLEISVLVAVDNKKPVGIVHLHELLKAGLS